MPSRRCRSLTLLAVLAVAATWPGPAAAQVASPAAPTTPPSEAPAAQAQPVRQPPEGTGPVVRTIELAFPRQGNVSVIEPQTYLYYLQTKPSRPSDGVWVAYDEQSVLGDFRRLWNTNFLDDLWVEVRDVPYPNGVVGKYIVFNMEERQRVKIVEYVGTKKLEATKIDEKLKEKGSQIRLDSFIDPALVRRVEGTIREMLAEKGYLGGEVTHAITPIPSGPKLVNLTFTISEGPQYKIKSVEFVGNKAVSDGKLAGQMKENKAPGMFSFITGKGTYQETKFEEDAEKVVEYYRDRGYIAARVGQPDLKVIEDSKDKKKRWVQLRIPVVEGERYRVGKFEFDGNTVVKSEGLRPLFKLKEGDFYSEKSIRKGLEKAREAYGGIGYFEFVGFPDLQPRDQPPGDEAVPEALRPAPAPGPPVVDVTMKMQEGKQYFVNRITFVGNSTTRDNVIRREMRLYESGVFNTEALKFSIRRLNQLGYFKNLEGAVLGSRNTLRALFDHLPAALYTIDVEYRLAAVNRTRTQRLDQAPRSLVGLKCYQALFDRSEPCVECRVRETLETGQTTQRSERRYVGDDVFEWEINSYPIRDDNDHIIQAVLIEQDVTERRRLEAILTQSEKLAAIGQLAAGVAHEINNPLTAIIANAQILHRELPANSDLQESVDLIARAGARATQVVRNLLDFARKEEYHLGVTDLNETLERALELVQHEILARGIRLEFKPDPNLAPILASQDHLQSVWLNLLLNAIDSLDKTPAEIRITTLRIDNEIHVQVSDNGKGIPSDRLTRIFDPFYTTKAAGRGTGLGLSVSHRIIRQHGGRIGVESQLGAGSTFTIVLPAS